MYSNAQYMKGLAGQITCIRVEIDGVVWYVSIDLANPVYNNIMALVAAGELTIAPAEGGN